MIQRERILGIFDSGIGGFFPLKALLSHNPRLSFIYLADHAFFPFGEKTSEAIAARTALGIESLKKEGATDILVACHTASLTCRPSFSMNTMLQASELAIESLPSHVRSILLLGTPFTIASHLYQALLKKKGIDVTARASQDLVFFSENFPHKEKEREKKIEALWEQFHAVDAVFLACTHFGIFKNHFAKKWHVADPSEYLFPYPAREEESKQRFLTTGKDLTIFQHQVSQFFPGRPDFECRQKEMSLTQEPASKGPKEETPWKTADQRQVFLQEKPLLIQLEPPLSPILYPHSNGVPLQG